MFNLIVSNGRVADRTPHTRVGALETALAVEKQYGITPVYVGNGEGEPAVDDWSISLNAGKEHLNSLYAAVSGSVAEKGLTVVINGTCPASLGTIPAVAEEYPDLCVLWIDAHGDFNIPSTTNSGYLGGMVVSALCGLWDSGCGGGVQPSNVILAGVRDLDQAESRLVNSVNVRTISPNDFTVGNVRRAIGLSKVWIHIDWDVLEPGYVPADYSVPGGLLPDRLAAVLGSIPLEQIVGLEIAEFNASCGEAAVQQATKRIIEIIDPLLSKACTKLSVSHV